MKYNHLFPVLLLFVFVFSFVGISRAANFTVNNNGDTSDAMQGNGICVDTGGNCTLRAAVEEANTLPGNDTIDFAASLTNATITLTTVVEIPISGTNGTLQINGLGADKLTIDGGAGSNRIFSTNAATVTITGVTLQGGNGNSVGQGGAIYANGGSLVLIAVLVQNNIVTDRGGGIYYNGGTNHRILNSTISGNKAFVGGGLFFNGTTLFVANTTVSGNSVTNSGSAAGGVYIGSGAVTFRNSTITNNTAAGSGSAAGGVQASGTLNFGNTIIAGNGAPNFPDIFNFGGAVSAGNNFVGNTSTNTAIAYQMSDILNQNPMLGVLQNTGGPTPTHALLTGSPAINAGDNAKAVDPFNNSTLTTDQRIIAPRIGGGTVDIGAYELNSATAASVAIGGRVTVGKRGLAQARVTLTDMNGETRYAMTNSFGYYRFDDVAAGDTYILSVFHKRYTFAPQVVSVFEEMNELNFAVDNGGIWQMFE